jgi:hypothetical protein
VDDQFFGKQGRWHWNCLQTEADNKQNQARYGALDKYPHSQPKSALSGVIGLVFNYFGHAPTLDLHTQP